MNQRCVLSEQQVKDIFRLKNTHGHKNRHAASVVLGGQYHVSSKTIRDIWSGRCWMKTTAEFWSEEELSGRFSRGQPRKSTRIDDSQTKRRTLSKARAKPKLLVQKPRQRECQPIWSNSHLSFLQKDNAPQNSPNIERNLDMPVTQDNIAFRKRPWYEDVQAVERPTTSMIGSGMFPHHSMLLDSMCGTFPSSHSRAGQINSADSNSAIQLLALAALLQLQNSILLQYQIL
mmetsp:Transcript_66021/g.176901  ORF Transcript_66021/g.176901 Transcript_66021/m.176901 type:complete len:231 (+) Transcript_66021:159-851(+)